LTGSQVYQAAQSVIASQKPSIDQVDELTQKLDILYREREKLQNGASPFGALATPESAREIERNREAINGLQDALTRLINTRQGGSATELLENTQAQAHARFKLDESAAALALAASLDKESSETKNLAEANALAKRAAQERQRGEELAAAATEASARRAAAAEEEGSAKQVAAILKSNAARRAVTQPGSAEYQNLAAADEAAQRQAETLKSQDAQVGENARFKIAQDGFAERATLIREEAQAHKISYAQELAGLLQNDTKEEAAEQEHWSKLAEIWGEGTSQYRDMQKNLATVSADYALKQTEDEKEIAKQQESAFGETWSAVTGQLNSAITSALTGKSRNAGRQFAQNLAMDTANALLTSLETALKQAFLNSAAGTALSGILGSAGGGGLFTTIFHAIGIPGFAAGAWDLPSDMIARVHQGEMIVPAGPAGAMRDALSGGAQSGGPARNINHSTNIHINAADAASVQRLFNDNDGALLKAIHRAVARGAHLGLRF
jgi:hypothetical protein